MIHFENVGVRYGGGPEVLCDVNLHIQPRSFHFLCGASGAGKTTLLRLMMLSMQQTRGLITILGKDTLSLTPAELPAIRRHIGVVFQDFRLLNHLTTYENVALPLRIMGKEEYTYQADVKNLLQWIGLGDHLDDYPSALSGGQQQRASIARALMNRPDILLADEPTGNVDQDLAQRLLRLFLELNKLGTAVIIATHDTKLIEAVNAPRLMLHNTRLTVT